MIWSWILLFLISTLGASLRLAATAANLPMRLSSLVLSGLLLGSGDLEELRSPEMQVLHLACSQQQMVDGRPSCKAWLASSHYVPSL